MSVASEHAIRVVKDYILELNEISTWQGYNFERGSYSKWFAMELLKSLKAQPSMPPLIVIENFRDSMDNYSCLSKEENFRIIFSIARDVTENIIDYLLS